MTRGGADSEEDSDEQGEPNPSSDPIEAGRQVPACHSDSEMVNPETAVARLVWITYTNWYR